MKYLLLLFSIFNLLSFSFGQNSIDSLRIKVANNQNPEKWNKELFNYDKESKNIDSNEPMKWVAYPVEDYDYYVFSSPISFKIDSSFFSGVTFGKNNGTEENPFVFDHKLTLFFYTGDSIYDIKNHVISRNAPYLTVEGSIKLNQNYEFIGSKGPDNTGTLFIGVKTFDLRFGQTIVIFPTAENSFYYLQLEDEIKGETTDYGTFLEILKTNPKIIEMLALVRAEN